MGNKCIWEGESCKSLLCFAFPEQNRNISICVSKPDNYNLRNTEAKEFYGNAQVRMELSTLQIHP